ncbi:hypothetical protein LSH36_52g05068 [Paralvinella palmiformis]|uniref:Uncharacterized protein n=1 Tax=Paralvinella palmiformis TaxID=53620 RepID=A0AAD9K5J8_9ANNE|nr:hypothetical protein LSH36_52g05068 [Paralvinella palmiformis]
MVQRQWKNASRDQPGYVMSTPLNDSTWGRTCNRCGNGMNLKLDYTNASPCQCQQDSIRVGAEGHWYPRAASVGRSGNPLPMPLTVTMSFPQRPFTPRPPSVSPKPSAMLPKHIHIDKNKLVTSIYSKAQTYHSTHANSEAGPNKPGKFVLRYTDGNIQKPEMTGKICSKPFPKLISRYIGKRVSKDTIPMCTEPYKQTKLAIVTQSFE